MQSVNTSNRRGTHVFYIIKQQTIAFFTKKARKNFNLMKTKEFTNPTTQTNQKTTFVHFYEEDEPCFPFSIVEEKQLDENGEVCEQSCEIVLGNTKLTQKRFNTLLEAETYILSKPYELITALMCCIVESHAQFVNENVELNKLKENEVQ